MGSSVLNHLTELQAGPWDEVALWLCGEKQAYESALIPKRPRVPHPSSAWVGASTSTKLPNGIGYHRIGTPNSWAFVRAGHYTRRPFQADQLHVDLWWHGLNLGRDPGTYLYNGGPPWNNGLAGTAVHNTVMIDGRDQMRRAGRFLWLDWAQASGKSFSTKNSNYLDCFEGEHDGYRKLEVKHRRMVRCVSEDAWVVVDDLLGGGEHELRLHWLLPDLPFQVIGDSPFCATLSADQTKFRWNLLASSPGNAALVRGGKTLSGHIEQEELLGWESPTYGELVPAISLVYRVHGALPVRIVTAILADPAIQLRQNERELVLSRGGSQLYQVSLDPAQTAEVNS